MKNKALLVTALIALVATPGLTENSQPMKLLACVVACLCLSPEKAFKIFPHHWAVFGWLVWAAIGCILSPFPSLAIYGFHLRYEGLITFVLLVYLAFEWSKNMELGAIGWIGSALSVAYLLLIPLLHDTELSWLMLPKVPMAGLLAVAFGVAYHQNRWLGLPIIACGMATGSRSFILCAGLAVACSECLKTENLHIKRIVVLASLLIVSVAILPFTPLAGKLKNTEFSGTGARAQWILQADTLSKSIYPWGLGLDTGSTWLKDPKAVYAEKGAISDKVHNVFYDILVCTGWVGLIIVFLGLGSCIYHAFYYPTIRNEAAAIGILCYMVFGVMNPTGIPATALMLICVFNLKRL